MTSVRAEVAAALEASGAAAFVIRQAEVIDSFDNACVTIDGPNVEVRIVRERGRVYTEIAPRHATHETHDATLVEELLDGSPDTSFLGEERGVMIDRFARFLTAHERQIRDAFAQDVYPETRRRLEELRHASARRRFGI